MFNLESLVVEFSLSKGDASAVAQGLWRDRTEHTHRPALKTLIESLDKWIKKE